MSKWKKYGYDRGWQDVLGWYECCGNEGFSVESGQANIRNVNKNIKTQINLQATNIFSQQQFCCPENKNMAVNIS